MTPFFSITLAAHNPVLLELLKSASYDPKASLQNPRWFNVEIKIIKKTRLIRIKELRQYTELTNMRILQQGNRLSITPIDPAEWQFITSIL